MIKKLTGEKWIKRYTNTSMAKIISDLKNDGDQVYIVGLDNHTGFLVCERGTFSFIHSSGRFPFCEIKEDAETSVVLNKSKYKVVGLLTQDNTFIEKWILGS